MATFAALHLALPHDPLRIGLYCMLAAGVVLSPFAVPLLLVALIAPIVDGRRPAPEVVIAIGVYAVALPGVRRLRLGRA